MGEHLLCKQGVVGSIPSSSTSFRGWTIGCVNACSVRPCFLARGISVE